MRLILTKDVKSIGKKGDLINASDGHAKNFLLPRGLAVEATKANINELELKQKSDEKKRQQEYEEARQLADKLKNSKVTISVKAGGNGKLFGSVTNKEIAQSLEEQTNIKIDKKKIVLDDTIRTTGSKQVKVKVHPKVDAELLVEITGE